MSINIEEEWCMCIRGENLVPLLITPSPTVMVITRKTLIWTIVAIILLGAGAKAVVSLTGQSGGIFSPASISREDPRAVRDAEKHEIMAYAYSVLDREFGRIRNALPSTPSLGAYDKVFVTFLRNRALRCSMSGRADREDPQRTMKDIEQAVVRCISDERFGGVLEEEEVNDVEIVINVLFNKRTVTGGWNALEKNIELGVHAIEVRQGDRNAYFKESVPISKDYDLEKTFERLCTKAELDEDCARDPETVVSIFDTLTFKGDRLGNITDLYRYNIFFTPDDISENLLHQRLRYAWSWFISSVNKKTGLLEYAYYPSRDSYSTNNNHVRQMASIWAVAELRRFLHRDELDGLITATLDHYLGFFTCRVGVCFIEIDGSSSIAYSAFAILSLISEPGYPHRDRTLALLAEGLLRQQQADGSFATYFDSDKSTGVDYYPGESLLALMRLYGQTRNEQYLDAVKRAFPYYRTYWRENKNTAFIPWHTQADLLLFHETLNPEVADFVFEMNDWLIDTHQITESLYKDLIGGFTKDRPRISTSSYLESINDAYVLAQAVGDRVHGEKYRESIRWATRFLLLLQFTPENSFYLQNPDRAIGGFRSAPTSNRLRNDNTQHASFALMKSYANGVFE